MTESPFSTQGWNRYSYVGNAPLNFTDPSGYCFLGCFWNKAFKAIGNLFRRVPLLGAVLRIAAAAICTPAGLGPVCGAAASAFVVGVTGGKLGDAIKAGLIAAVTAGAFHVVGEVTAHGVLTFGSSAHLANIAGHAAVGCLSSAASGGKCGPGAAAGAIGSFAGPLIGQVFPNQRTDTGHFAGATIAHAAVGGLASVAAGDKFENGAVTAAFGYLYNAANSPPPPTGDGSKIPNGPWTWSEDPNNTRGGKYLNPDGMSASWDNPGGHWDVDDGSGNRQRYNRWGAPLTPDQAHGNYEGPRRMPLPRWPITPFNFIPNPCIINPRLCGLGNEG